MKRIILLIIISSLLITLVACGQRRKGKSTNQLTFTHSESSMISTPSSGEDVKMEGIKGSNYTDIKSSLEQRGFEVVHPKDVTETKCKVYNNNYMDPDSGIKYGCGMTIDNYSAVVDASFSVENIKGAKSAMFLEAAGNYLKSCSAMPYDTSKPDDIKIWVSKNLSTAKNEPSTQIGDVRFTLSGTANVIILCIQKK